MKPRTTLWNAPRLLPALPAALLALTLAASVKDALLDAKALNAHDIDVVAKRGVVTLFGTTKTHALRSMAEKVAARVGGVTLVENKLAVVAGS